MQRRLAAVVGGSILLAGVLAGCGSADKDTFAAEARADGVGGGELDAPMPLVMPHRAVTLTHSTVSDTLDEQLAADLGVDDSDLDAADGYEFVAASFTVERPPYEDDGGEARVNVVTEDAPHDITETVVEQMDADDEIVVVASVPVDSAVALEIADQGKTASLDLRTGELSEQTMSDATGAYYPVWSDDIDGTLNSTAVLTPTDPAYYPDWVGIDLSLSQSRISANGWIPGVGWVPDDQTFLVVSDVVATLRLAAGLCGITWDPATSVTFTPDGGAPTPATGFSDGEYFTRADFAFAVPRGTTGGTLTLAPQTTVNGDCELVQPFQSAVLTVALDD